MVRVKVKTICNELEYLLIFYNSRKDPFYKLLISHRLIGLLLKTKKYTFIRLIYKFFCHSNLVSGTQLVVWVLIRFRYTKLSKNVSIL